MRSIALFGGTFDPIHNGHINTSITIQTQFHFDAFYFLPCNIPVIKTPAAASASQRIAMLDLALKNHPQFAVDQREIQRNSPSYMVDTLNSFRAEDECASITLIIGYDAFLSLPSWHKWEELLQLANLLIINRARFKNDPIPESLMHLIKSDDENSQNNLLQSRAGTVCFFDAGNYDVSSTNIRQQIKDHKIIKKTDLPVAVYEYIKLWKLYQ